MKVSKITAAVTASFILALFAPFGEHLLSATEIQSVRVEPTALLLEDDSAGRMVERESLREATGPNTYLTSAAVDGRSGAGTPRRIIVSTTFHGLYESTDGGVTWIDLGDRGEIEVLHLGNGFYEDISAVAYDSADEHILWIEFAQDGRVVALDRRTGRIIEQAGGTGSRAFSRTVRVAPPDHPPLDEAARQRRKKAENHVSFYLSPWQLNEERLAEHMRFAGDHGFTAVVIDFKDDGGRLVYDSRLSPHDEVGAVTGRVSARRIIDTVHDAGLYLIARVVVFKDERLYRYDDNRYALWDRRRNAPWGVFREEINEETEESEWVQSEFWVDPFSEFVWNYNIAVARELEQLGVDEIQFDYIRTPAEGRVGDIEYRYHDGSPLEDDDPFLDERVKALSTFLSRARRELTIPIGIDVFGFNGWYRMSYLGQDIAVLSGHVDVISPMLYPSHFPRSFRGDLPYLEWAEWIYREGTARGVRITDEHVLIRPYIQAFLIGGELQFELPTYTDYLKRQIRGSIEGGGSGITLWNNSGRYYMVERGLWYDRGPVIGDGE